MKLGNKLGVIPKIELCRFWDRADVGLGLQTRNSQPTDGEGRDSEHDQFYFDSQPRNMILSLQEAS